MITIDGTKYDVGIVKITRKASIDKEDLAKTLDGKKHVAAKGTYYNYEVTFATMKMNVEEYDRLYEVLTAPVDYHTVTLPYGQTDITFDADITVGNDDMICSFTSFRKWGSLKVTINSLEPQRVAE